jgi:hypothetical protein
LWASVQILKVNLVLRTKKYYFDEGITNDDAAKTLLALLRAS